MITFKPVHALVCCAALAAALAAPAVEAKVLASGTYPYNKSSPGRLAVPLTTRGATALTFNASKAGTYVLTFSAECSADNGSTSSTSGWVQLDIEVNGAVLPATVGSDDAFCSPNDNASQVKLVRASITLPIQLVAGRNTVRIFGDYAGGASFVWLSNTAIVIHD